MGLGFRVQIIFDLIIMHNMLKGGKRLYKTKTKTLISSNNKKAQQ
jgi:hypothetical protein